MVMSDRPFRSEQSYAFEHAARNAVVPFLRSRGFIVNDQDDLRSVVGLGQSQQVIARSPQGEILRLRVRLCWRRDGRNAKEAMYSAAQLAAKTREGGWQATLDYLERRDLAEGVTHTLFFQRNVQTEVYAALVPTRAVTGIWQRQYEVSNTLIAAGRLGNLRKNHAANGHSPTIWLQDDRQPEGYLVADVLWQWPGVVDLMALPVVAEHSPAKYWRMLDAVDALGGVASVAEVRQWLERNMPGADYSDTRENLSHLTVNDPNRRHYDRSRPSFRSDQGHRRDVLYRSGEGAQTRYQRYVPSQHGVFDLIADADGRFRAVQVMGPVLVAAYGAAEQAVEESVKAESIASEADARNRQLRAVVMRRGQQRFRTLLLEAYGGRCAVTGCDVRDVLEAAHIVPYLGDHTHRMDNGLLLRADIHTLFDLGQLWIDVEMKVRVADGLRGSCYGELEGSALRLPERRMDAPHPDHLMRHRRTSAAAQDEAEEVIS